MDAFKTFTLRLEPKMSKELKMYAVESEQSMQDIIVELIREKLEKEKNK